ncbi:response regulator [Algoriphagus sp. C2-6-M1]|uniref:response regulator n=1 Tax=Algoriphagus persicinus TaxID=3108754 RepID=UPI002B3F638A|nr:response regulator [Algoriphagus sp. C2-6-M1]MEB2780971.1 response regulator [Algoriphagus sp. C2-6-M1]
MSSKHKTILVIEDNEGDFVLIEDYLIEAFKIIQINRYETFSDFKKFIDKKSDLNYDLILLDLHLPDLSGIELIESLLASKILVPIIILTGYADLSLAKESLKLGVDDFLIKDEITPNILYKSIEFAFSRDLYIKQIQAQNEKLKSIAWTQSHVVRAPLSRILGIINLIETQKDNLDDLMFWLNQLRVSSEEMDAIVKNITDEAQKIQLNKNNE